MPLYEDRRNAENIIAVSRECAEQVLRGTETVISAIMDAVREREKQLHRHISVAFDGWYGIEWPAIIRALQESEAKPTHEIAFINTIAIYKTVEEIKRYKAPFLTEDPGFGYVNNEGRVEELFDQEKVQGLRNELSSHTKTVILYGCGAGSSLLGDLLDLCLYFDKTRQPMLWQMWDKELVPFGMDQPDPNYSWKEYYYSDYHMLDHQKEYLFNRMDYWVEAIDPLSMALIPRNCYHEIIQSLIRYPVKEIKIYQPGPWGAYRYHDLFDVPGLECNAWNELAGPELGVIIDLGNSKQIEMPMLNLMAYQSEYLGPILTEKYPRLFPMDVWLDDGYFPTATPIERTAMPIHNHPSTGYVKRHFNEPLGRYETYYICEAYEGACTILGYKDEANIEKWEEVCRKSNNLQPIANWKDYFSIWDSNIGDLFLIPPGTAHGHGGNQMVLEMDTCPSIAATEYSFFEYDFARNSWDDKAKDMIAPPMKMHTDHSFDCEHWRRESWVKDNLLSKPKVVKWTKDYKHDLYHSTPEMPFDIERFHFYSVAEGNTRNEFPQILTLTIGKRAVIRSIVDKNYCTEIELFQSAIVPASFGAYEVVSLDGGFCEVVVMKWKSQDTTDKS